MARLECVSTQGPLDTEVDETTRIEQAAEKAGGSLLELEHAVDKAIEHLSEVIRHLSEVTPPFKGLTRQEIQEVNRTFARICSAKREAREAFKELAGAFHSEFLRRQSISFALACHEAGRPEILAQHPEVMKHLWSARQPSVKETFRQALKLCDAPPSA